MGQTRESLRDLDGVRVSIEALPPAAAGYGVSADALKQSVEGALARAGITILGIGDFPVGDPYLRVRVDATAAVRGLAAYTVDVDFVQIVFMRRNPAVTFNRAETWAAPQQLGLAPPGEIRDRIARALTALVDAFVADYRLANAGR